MESWWNYFTLKHFKILQVDGKVRTDPKFPAGFMDVIQIEKTNENFRLIFDVKGRSVQILINYPVLVPEYVVTSILGQHYKHEFF